MAKVNLKSNEDSFSLFQGLLLFFAVAIVPLIVKISIVGVSADEYGFVRISETVNDIFSYNKAIAICVVAALIILEVIFGFLAYDRKIHLSLKSFPVVAGLSYITLALVSAIFSDFKTVSFAGISERYEGFWVLASYIVLLLAAINFAHDKKGISFLSISFLIGGSFVLLIGVFQFFGKDIFATEFFEELVFGQYYTDSSSLNIKYDSVFSTLYNPNCMGAYAAMFFAFSIVGALFMPLSDKIKYGFIAVAIFSVICLIGSDSAGGLLAAIASLGFVAIIGIIAFLRKKDKKAGIISLAVSVALGGGALIWGLNSDALIFEKLDIIFDAVSGKTTIESPYFYNDYYIDENEGVVELKTGEVRLVAVENGIDLYFNGEKLPSIQHAKLQDTENGYVNFYQIELLESAKVQVNEKLVSFVGNDGNKETLFYFYNDNGKLSLLNKFAEPIEGEVKASGFEGIELLGSSRGYIWSRSIPLLGKYFIIGSGPDCFSLVFPQNDVAGKTKFLGNPYVIVDKPHNMFVQIAVNTGLVSLLVFLALVIWYIIGAVKLILKGCDDKLCYWLGASVLAGVVAYLVAGFSTDSVVSVAPVFWVLLGFGIAVNKFSLNK